ncbi:chemotaxis-specific protein-glutamate methyltransferase CheB [Pyxidicoccus fallax]|uniref:Protein-glutamate methylesterase/protein-glutamine glutaminase n=1 Tax=Pyxidicoccus fallax TaxID=394095 RepID=A0A848LKS8_9BACT|nr:chemotaxis-specific protein-glutamate methyltransferase CheB [Pyxidicoccus fallax]NMO18300.1 chemotaxis-specific protein-glutamate methyltransferase CheB [Pyxidicoccus fallax]NPC80743.1 chemotaxis-specific protein-glutamate methyltransferase CheB [Pyxidicoccus fallax]
MTAPIRVLVVDDSAFARKVLRQVLSNAQGMEVVGTARDGLDALEKVAELSPDVLTLDLVMPGLDGLGVLRALASMAGAPRVVVVSSAGEESELAVSALQAGAVELVNKPTALATDRLYELGEELVEKVRTAARALPRPIPEAALSSASSAVPSGVLAPSRRLVVVGTSTGGPQALTQLLAAMPADFPAPMALALHIPTGYTQAVAKRLDARSALEVVEAEDGVELRPGRVVLARAGHHLKVERHGAVGVARLDRYPLRTPHHPSVDVLFESAAKAWGADTVGLVLTGMGDDGLAGARAIRAAGGTVLTEAEASCVVYGMPRAVDEAGLATATAPLEGLAALLNRHTR